MTKSWVKDLLRKLNIGKYSTDEIRVGTWIDGKPLYRKVVSGTLGKTTTEGTLVNVFIPINASVDTFIDMKAMIAINGFILHSNYSDNGKGRLAIYGCDNVSSTNPNTVRVSHSSVAWSNVPVTVILEYTKTTD